MATLRRKKGFIPGDSEPVEEVSFEKSDEDIDRMHQFLTPNELGVAQKPWEKVDVGQLKKGDRIVLYGLEVGVITETSTHEAHVQYTHKGTTYTGLPPRKTKEAITRIVDSKK